MHRYWVLVVFVMIMALGGFRDVGFGLSLRFAILFAIAVWEIKIYREKCLRPAADNDWTKTPTPPTGT